MILTYFNYLLIIPQFDKLISTCYNCLQARLYFLQIKTYMLWLGVIIQYVWFRIEPKIAKNSTKPEPKVLKNQIEVNLFGWVRFGWKPTMQQQVKQHCFSHYQNTILIDCFFSNNNNISQSSRSTKCKYYVSVSNSQQKSNPQSVSQTFHAINK